MEQIHSIAEVFPSDEMVDELLMDAGRLEVFLSFGFPYQRKPKVKTALGTQLLPTTSDHSYSSSAERVY